MDHDIVTAVHVTDLEHSACMEYSIDKSTDVLLATLASIVVDEIMRLGNAGMKLSDIIRMYEESIPSQPPVPTRKRRHKKETTA